MSAGPVKRICLVGATGLVGYSLLEEAVGREDVRLVAVARREVALPPGARMEMLVGDTGGWPRAIAAARADVLVCALGTTMRRAGGEEAFRAIDHDLVLACARAARDAGIERMIVVSSVGADRASRAFYLRTKGETDEALGKLGFRRLDILRPGLLRGSRAESRPFERLAQAAAPLADLFLQGGWRRFRAVRARSLARAILALAHEKAAGRFIHEYDGIQLILRRAGE
ncbi:NAD(P)H-binding protein [Novosphingobium album (ex Liu et al. 2023)]|uniref:NAD(P)H-binding protein n=1 Tax=Novosphingobium album (ex Liu et al. 2023) TaxID=3031130 RepID=A0ABT5WW29_9SPHN|nr:NAD(P)H-binding protein [Novosphingobium album (ex Liu et al. 2023)]MDE8654088.1 NAD(P)H-binding protein [Novosphingobium album (ex Liu et al. 2023)]